MSDMALMDKLVQIEELNEEGGWDQLPSLYFLSRKDDEVVLEVFAVIDASSFRSVYDAFAQVMASPPKPEYTPIAVAFCTEGWAPGIPEGLNLADQKAFMANYPYRKFADDPNRIEIRGVIALTADGGRYSVSRMRGEEIHKDMTTQDALDERGQVLGVGETGYAPLKSLLDVWVGGAQ